MKYLLDTSSFYHNIDSKGEGAYRINNFEANTDIKSFINGEDYLGLVHSDRHIRKFKKSCEIKSTIAEVRLAPESYDAACNSVGLTILASKQNDFAIVRPPGHHAFNETISGFCFLNNIAIASQNLVNEGKKVAIIDIDGHHGDGTQRIFFQSNKVFFTSIHQVGVFPGTGYSYEEGKGEGKGFTKNFPLKKGDGDVEFLNALDNAIIEIEKYGPDIVAVSAGFDGYYKDTILDLELTLDAYYQCGKRLSEKFINIFAVLEGGYHNDIKECIENFIKGVNKK